MNLLNLARKIIISLAQSLTQAGNKAWWVKITTVEPDCVYYFGPFQSSIEARSNHSGYIADLADEGAKGITVIVRRCNPEVLTTYDEENI